MNINLIKNNYKIIKIHLGVSAICASSEMIIFFTLITVFTDNLFIAHAGAFFIATFIGYILHSYFTFSIGKLLKRNALFFLIQALLALFIGYVILNFLIMKGNHPLTSKAVQLSLTFIFNISFGKFISFKNNKII